MTARPPEIPEEDREPVPEGEPDAAMVALRRAREAARLRGELAYRSDRPIYRGPGATVGTGAGKAGPGTAGPGGSGRAASSSRGRAGRDERDPAMVGEVFTRLIRDRGWSTPVAVGSVLTRWAELVGPEIALHCRPESFENAVVRVRTSSTAWATQLKLLSPMLLERFAAELGPEVVRRIEVAGPAAPSWRHGPRTVRGRGPRDTYG